MRIFLLRAKKRDGCAKAATNSTHRTRGAADKADARLFACSKKMPAPQTCKPGSVFDPLGRREEKGENHFSQRSTRKLLTVRNHTKAFLFDLAPRRVWLFSLRRLPLSLPFPARGSMPRTFSLFHCSSGFPGWLSPVAVSYGARTFLKRFTACDSPACE